MMCKFGPIVAGFAILIIVSSNARAQISIIESRIVGGELRVNGRTPQPNQLVTLDTAHEETSDDQRRFSFRLTYFPADCSVTLVAGDMTREALVGNCSVTPGPPGAPAPQGAQGEPGPPAAPGPR